MRLVKSCSPSTGNDDASHGFDVFICIVCLTVGLFAVGCSSLRVHELETRAAHGDDHWIADQSIICHEAADACARQHLIKGEACYRLARSGDRPRDRYACAADELEIGLGLSASAKEETRHDRAVLQERLCESLLQLQAMQSGAAAGQTLKRLAQAAQTLYALRPEGVPAIYYLSRVRLIEIEPRLPAITVADRLPVCSRLKRTVTRVLAVMENAELEPPPDWEHFADRYERLVFDLGAAMRAAECR